MAQVILALFLRLCQLEEVVEVGGVLVMIIKESKYSPSNGGDHIRAPKPSCVVYLCEVLYAVVGCSANMWIVVPILMERVRVLTMRSSGLV